MEVILWDMHGQVGIQAYLMWEAAGKPDGADFAGDARRSLEAQLSSGMSVQQLEKSLKEPQAPQVAISLPHAPSYRWNIPHRCLPTYSRTPVLGDI